MRPRTITLKGFRSYRTERTIEFGDRDLVAIVGRVGAGKSSIFSGMTFALYGKSQWSGRDRAELVNDDERTAVVHLEFSARGKDWMVERGVSTGPYPPPHQKLVCLSDPSLPALLDREEVNDAIEGLLGLDFSAFKTSAVLPQGKFAELLTGDPRERARILRSILGIDTVAVVHKRAVRVEERLNKALHVRREELAALGRPREVAEVEGNARMKAEGEEKRLAAIVQAARTMERDVAKTTERHDAIREARKPFTSRPWETVKRDVAILRRQAEELQSPLDAAKAALAEKLVAARQAVGAADDWRLEHGDLTILARVAEQLRAFPGLVSAAEDARKLASDEAAAVLALEDAVQESQVALQPRETEAAAADNERECLQKSVDGLRSRRSAAEASLNLIGRNRKELALAQGKNATLELERKSAEHDLAKARESELIASEAQNLMEETVSHMERAHHAVCAAHGLVSGDKCPICAAVLPAAYAPPADSDEVDRRRAELTDARKERTKLHGQATVAAERLDEANRKEASANKEEGTRQAALESSLEVLHDSEPGVDASLEDCDALASLAADITIAVDAVGVADAHYREVDRARQAVVTRLEERRSALTSQRERGHKAVQQCASQLKRIQASFDAIPSALRPTDANKPKSIEEATKRVEALLAEGTTLEAARIAASTDRECAAAVAADLEEDWATKVRDPIAHLARTAESLRNACESTQALIGVDTSTVPVAMPKTSSIDATLSWVASVANSSLATEETLTSVLAVAAEECDAATQALAATLHAGGCKTLEDLVLACGVSKGKAEEARRHEEAALAAIPRADALEAAIAPGERRLATVVEARKNLGDAGEFEKYVVGRRQSILLQIAGRLFQTMTDGRYTFAGDDFRVVAASGGRERSAETLSGGETFLASLALALGLVEVSSRGGGRTECLVLDEGFGSLDRDSLILAVDALTIQARATGRFVAVVSHVPMVADAADEVLCISMREGTSGHRWKDEMADAEWDEFEAALVTS